MLVCGEQSCFFKNIIGCLNLKLGYQKRGRFYGDPIDFLRALST